MTLLELKSIIDKALEYTDNNDAEIIIVVGKRGEYKLSEVYQGGVIPTLYLHTGEKTYQYENY